MVIEKWITICANCTSDDKARVLYIRMLGDKGLIIVDLYSDIKNKVLDLNCISMRLIQCSKERPEVFSGTGFIKQDNEGKLSFRLLYDGRQDPSINKKLAFLYSLSSGSIIPEEHFFDLEATDIHV